MIKKSLLENRNKMELLGTDNRHVLKTYSLNALPLKIGNKATLLLSIY